MANGTGSGGSVSTTAAVALPVGAGLIVATYLTHPVWPPSQEVLTVVVTAAAPMLHLIYRGIYRKVTGWAGEPDDQNGAPAPVPAPVPPPPPQHAQPPVVAPSPQPQPQGQPA